jgi:hypothetical protein
MTHLVKASHLWGPASTRKMLQSVAQQLRNQGMTRAAAEVEHDAVLDDAWTRAHRNFAVDVEKLSQPISESTSARPAAPTTKSGSAIIALINDYLSGGVETDHRPL